MANKFAATIVKPPLWQAQDKLCAGYILVGAGRLCLCSRDFNRQAGLEWLMALLTIYHLPLPIYNSHSAANRNNLSFRGIEESLACVRERFLDSSE